MYLFLFAFEGHVVFPPKDHESEPYRFPMTLQAPELNTQHVAVYSVGHNDRQDKHVDFFSWWMYFYSVIWLITGPDDKAFFFAR